MVRCLGRRLCALGGLLTLGQGAQTDDLTTRVIEDLAAVLGGGPAALPERPGLPGNASGSASGNGPVFTISLRSQPLLCLDLKGGNTGNGNGLQIWGCNGLESQLWYFDAGTYNLQYAGDRRKCIDTGNMAQGMGLKIWDCNGTPQQKMGYDTRSGAIWLAGAGAVSDLNAKFCLDLAGGQTTQGTSVQVWGCNGQWQQQWNLLPGYGVRVHQDSSLCLDAAGTNDGAKVQIWKCNGHPNQYWVFDSWQLRFGPDMSKCLDAGDSAAGRALKLWSCNGQPQQRWGYDAREGTLYLASSEEEDASKCADVAGGSLSDGTAVQVWSCNGCWNQQFRIIGPVTGLESGPAMEVRRRLADPQGRLQSGGSCPGPSPGPGPSPSPPPGPAPSPEQRLVVVNACNQDMWIASSANVPGARNVRIAPGQSYAYTIPMAGLASTRFWPKMYCNANGGQCKIGSSGGPGQDCPAAGCAPPVDSKFEGSFGCALGAGCPAGTDKQDWWDTSAVDGYTLPFKVEFDKTCNAKVPACTTLHLGDCPTSENLGAAGTQDLRVRHPETHEVVGCYSPCGKLSFSNWNNPTGNHKPQDGVASPYCCPTPPVSTEQCRNGPVPKTGFVNLVHQKCANVYGYAYDDVVGLQVCPAGTRYTWTIMCPAAGMMETAEGANSTNSFESVVV